MTYGLKTVDLLIFCICVFIGGKWPGACTIPSSPRSIRLAIGGFDVSSTYKIKFWIFTRNLILCLPNKIFYDCLHLQHSITSENCYVCFLLTKWNSGKKIQMKKSSVLRLTVYFKQECSFCHAKHTLNQ